MYVLALTRGGRSTSEPLSSNDPLCFLKNAGEPGGTRTRDPLLKRQIVACLDSTSWIGEIDDKWTEPRISSPHHTLQPLPRGRHCASLGDPPDGRQAKSIPGVDVAGKQRGYTLAVSSAGCRRSYCGPQRMKFCG